MKPRVYLESSVISYMTARISRDLVVAAHQQITRDWWESASAFELCISDYVLAEISTGDEGLARIRVELVSDALLLQTNADAETLADQLILQKSVPAKARLDALHIAVCALNGIDYLLTWNCKHIANAQTMHLIEKTCVASGYACPRLCTPLELLES